MRYAGPARSLTPKQIEYNLAVQKFKNGARVRVSRAVKAGRLTRLPCEWPEDNHRGEAQGHHPDYSRPYEVIWLCKRHHTDLHSVDPYEAPIPEYFQYSRT